MFQNSILEFTQTLLQISIYRNIQLPGHFYGFQFTGHSYGFQFTRTLRDSNYWDNKWISIYRDTTASGTVDMPKSENLNFGYTKLGVF